MTDQNRKTLRSFYCRDYLWELFEQMTHDLGCSMDYLINESMRLYARSRDYVPANESDSGQNFNSQGGGGFGGQQGGGMGGQQQRSGGFGGQQSGNLNVGGGGFGQGGGAMDHRTFDRIPPVGNQGGGQPQRGMGGGQQGGFGGGQQQQRPGGPPPPPPGPSSGMGGGSQPGGGGQPGWGGQSGGQQGGFGGQQPGGSGFNGQPQGGGGMGMSAGGQPPLYLIFNNNRYVIDKEKFVIGRGSQQTDLTIRDGNISRKHCAILFRNGAYYIRDLDSTNGVEYRGNRIESKKIEEGDVFYLCDYELRFTMRP
jgi:hypothetical protein